MTNEVTSLLMLRGPEIPPSIYVEPLLHVEDHGALTTARDQKSLPSFRQTSAGDSIRVSIYNEEGWRVLPRTQGEHNLLSHYHAAAAAAKSLQSCPTLCGPIDGSPPGSPVPGILQARTLEWVAISFSNAWKWKVKLLSCVRLLATPWTAAYQAAPSMGFSRQEYWSGLPLPSP